MAKQMNKYQEFAFVIKEHLGILNTSQNGWTKEVNIIEWNGNPAKLDIREWDPDHEHMSKGITMHKPEALKLMKILLEHYGEEAETCRDAAGARDEADAADDADDADAADDAGEACEDKQAF